MSEHGRNCDCDWCVQGKKRGAEIARRLRHQRRKMEAEDRERERILGTDRAKRDNKFLADCGIAPVTFDRGQIVPWKGLLCDDNERCRGQSQILLEA